MKWQLLPDFMPRDWSRTASVLICVAWANFGMTLPALAQSIDLPADLNPDQLPLPEPIPPRPEPPLPAEPLPQLPPPEQLLPAPPSPPLPALPGAVPDAVLVDRFEVVGSTVFTPAELSAVTAPFAGRRLSFAELLQARSAVTQLYVENGYITSGAILPPQTLQAGVVQIQVIEGSLEAIQVTGTDRLRPSYVRDRLALAAATPLNVNRLLEALQLLQLDPLIANISADLQAGARPNTSLLQVQVEEADSFSTQLASNNGRSPSVGSFRRQVGLRQANLLGMGDGISISYSNTDGSSQWSASYALPVNPHNGTVQLAIDVANSEVIEEPFDALEIEADSRSYELSFRQPIAQTPTEEFALGLTASRQESETELGFRDLGGYPLSPGADDEGRTRISALRFSQEWTQRSRREVFAVRSQLSLGVDWFDATVNDDEPDSRFLAWRGQAQYVRLLARDTLLLVRSDVQLADDALVSLEQFGLGGQDSVRGYRQDALLSDNGVLLSAEVRLPIARPFRSGLVQLAPFVDIGTAWNHGSSDPDPSTLVGVGLGLLWEQGDFSARLDYGLPLVAADSEERTWQENGLYFAIEFAPL